MTNSPHLRTHAEVQRDLAAARQQRIDAARRRSREARQAEHAAKAAERDATYPRGRMPRVYLEQWAARDNPDFGHLHRPYPATCMCLGFSDFADEALTLLDERDAALKHLDALIALDPDYEHEGQWWCQSCASHPHEDDCRWLLAKQWREAHQ